MAAAIADHGGGEIALRGMVMSLGGEIATPALSGFGGHEGNRTFKPASTPVASDPNAGAVA